MACSDKQMPQLASISISPAFSTASNSFAIDFWKAADQDESYILSPLSLNIGLGMILAGTEGETRQEIVNTLGIEHLNQQEVNRSYYELINKLPLIDQKVTNYTANSVWASEIFNVKDTYLEELQSDFMAEVYKRDFSNPVTVDQINEWASDKTRGKIDEILDEISPDQVMFLINALYFKGDWTYIFPEKSTSKGDFYGETGTTQQDFMKVKADFGYYKNENYTAAELPFGNEKYTFIAILPEEGSTEEFMDRFSYREWKNLNNNLKPMELEVWLPKFTLETDLKLNETVQNMGIRKIFNSSAEFEKISDDQRLAVDFIKQSAYIGVDEKGAEAAAVTTTGFYTTSAGPQTPVFVCNRPFLFAIVEKTSDTIQFIGKINDF